MPTNVWSVVFQHETKAIEPKSLEPTADKPEDDEPAESSEDRIPPPAENNVARSSEHIELINQVRETSFV